MPKAEPKKVFPVWRRVLTGGADPGGGPYGPYLARCLAKTQVAVSPVARDVIAATTFQPGVGHVRLARIRLSDLGARDRWGIDSVFAAARKHGLGGVTAEVIARCRMQYLDQPHGEGLLFAMTPAVGPHNVRYVLGMQRDEREQGGPLRLSAYPTARGFASDVEMIFSL